MTLGVVEADGEEGVCGDSVISVAMANSSSNDLPHIDLCGGVPCFQSFTWHSLPRHHKIRDQRAECKRTADEDNADARSYTPRAVEYHRAFLTDFQHSVYLGFCLFAVMAVSLA